MGMAIFNVEGMLALIGFGLIYGIFIDVVTSRLEERI
jgi:prepilin signal peptidase PulO-like enzyme (type II secretory pathway)